MKPIPRDLPTPLHLVDARGVLLCLNGIHDGEPQYLSHGTDGDNCSILEE